jgi:tRNA(Arg) A34 adenosine deaminase TadA
MAGAKPPAAYAGRPLAKLWARPLGEVIGLAPTADLRPEWQERHRIYSLLTLALLAAYFNGNNRGPQGTYPWRERQVEGDHYRGGAYLGHNIAAVAVDPAGRVIDFDFNHNEIFNSSVEHAESRLLRRLFSLANLREDWSPPTEVALRDVDARGGPMGAGAPGDLNAPHVPTHPYGSLLSGYTIYTSLESCAQCSGIMTLARLKQVVYCQRDPGQYMIGFLMATLGMSTGTGGRSYPPPVPIAGDTIGLEQFGALEKAFGAFRSGLRRRAYYVSPGGRPERTASITSFLCTDLALEIFEASRAQLDGLQLAHPRFPEERKGWPENTLSNQQALGHARAFLEYAIEFGRRGTPHQL